MGVIYILHLKFIKEEYKLVKKYLLDAKDEEIIEELDDLCGVAQY